MAGTTRRRGGAKVLLALATAATFLLAACSSPGEDPTSGTEGAQDETQPAEVVERELALAVLSPPNSLDPALVSDGQATFVWNSIFETLAYKENGTGETKPWAAEGWEYSEDGLTLTITLREGLTFSDGDPVTAADVAATMERTRVTPGGQAGKLSNVTSVTAPDDSTVVVAFDEFDPAFVASLSSGMGVIADAETLEDERTATDPLGSGPYVLDTEATVAGSSYVLNRREDYWDKDSFPYTKVTVTVLQDPAAGLNAFQAGEVNAVTIRPQQFGAIEGVDGAELTTIDAQATILINFLDRTGENFPQLGDVRVRQAVNLAFDREGILNQMLQGQGMVTNQVFSPYGQVFDESLNSTYGYDPERARELLAEAGYPDGFSIAMPSYYSSTPFEPIISQQLGDIGIDVEWVPVTPQQVHPVSQSGEYGMMLSIIGFFTHQKDALDYFGLGGFNNPSGHTDEVLAASFEQIGRTIDQEGALPFYRELNEHAVEEALAAPIVFSGTTWATRDGVTYLDDGSSGWQSVRLFGVSE